METDVAVVGGGLGGLVTATLAAQRGLRATVLESSSRVGGRALSQTLGSGVFNLGPHALYRGGASLAVLARMGITPKGKVPTGSGGFAYDGGRLHALPAGPVSLLTTGLMNLPEKLELGRVLARLLRLEPHALSHLTVNQWLERDVRHERVRELLRMLIRVGTYTNAPDLLSAEVAVTQLQLALAKNVLYLDGGWSSLVSAVQDAAVAAGVTLVTGAKAVRVVRGARGYDVLLSNGQHASAPNVVIASTPRVAASLLDDAGLSRWANEAIPARAACLDLALTRLPRPRSPVAFGIDRPLYASVHSNVAALSPDGTVVLQMAKYLGPQEPGESAEAELEAMLDLFQPGWREHVIARRFMPNLVVHHGVPTARSGGFAGRPGPALPGRPGVFLVGDWVGADGMLLNAVLSSAEQVAAQLDDAKIQRQPTEATA